MQVSSVVAYICYKAMYIILFIPHIAKCIHELHWNTCNSWYLNVTFLSQQDLHWVLWHVLICHEQCIKMMQMLPFHLKETLKKLILHSGPWQNAEDRTPLLPLHYSHNVKSSNLGKCNDFCLATHYLVVFTLALLLMVGATVAAALPNMWHVAQFTCQIMCQVGLKPLETLSTNRTTSIRCWCPCWLR